MYDILGFDKMLYALGSAKDRYYQSILHELMETITVEDAILLYKKGEDVTFLNDEQRYCIFKEYNFSYIKSLSSSWFLFPYNALSLKIYILHLLKNLYYLSLLKVIEINFYL
jgi:hypothetical protein